MSPTIALNRCSHLCALAFFIGFGAHASDNPPIPEGYKQVKLASGASVLIQDEDAQPHQASAKTAPDKSDISAYDLNQTSPLANKTFMAGTASGLKRTSPFDRNDYIVKTFGSASASDHALPNLNSKFPTSATIAYGRNATGMNKTFTSTTSDVTDGKSTLFASNTSHFQGRTALLNGHAESMTASPLADKTYTEPLPVIRQEINKINFADMKVKDLPDRPLTIDEVRALINHGIEPDTTTSPAPPTKALNDPDYQPEPSPPPPDTPALAPAVEDDKNDPVPSPGTIAQPPPENSEALPQH